MYNEIRGMTPKGLESYPHIPNFPDVKVEAVDIPIYKHTINDTVNWMDFTTLFIRESVITNILTMKKGITTMDDPKTTISGAVVALAQLAGLLGVGIPASVITVITALGVLAFGYFAKDKPAV